MRLGFKTSYRARPDGPGITKYHSIGREEVCVFRVGFRSRIYMDSQMYPRILGYSRNVCR